MMTSPGRKLPPLAAGFSLGLRYGLGAEPGFRPDGLAPRPCSGHLSRTLFHKVTPRRDRDGQAVDVHSDRTNPKP